MSELFNSGRGLIVVKVILKGPGGEFSIRMALDTGATITSISSGILVMAGYDPMKDLNRYEMTTVSGIEYVPMIKIESLEGIGQKKVNFPIIGHTLPPSAGVDGLLGLDFLRNQKLTIDFREGDITLE
jgi:predicted aspartyl protease